MPANLGHALYKSLLNDGLGQGGRDALELIILQRLNAQFAALLVAILGQAPASERVFMLCAEAKVIRKKVFK